MANAVRPEGVPEEAVVVPPSKATQTEYIVSVRKQVIKQNAKAIADYGIDMQEWSVNAHIYADYDMPIPPMPHLPDREVLHVVYADAAGNPVEPADAMDESMYAWIWQTSDGVWFGAPKAAARAR